MFGRVMDLLSNLLLAGWLLAVYLWLCYLENRIRTLEKLQLKQGKHLNGLGVQLKRLRERLSEPKKPSSAKSEGPKTSIESSPSQGASALAPNDSKNSPTI